MSGTLNDGGGPGARLLGGSGFAGKTFLQLSLNYHSIAAVKQESTDTFALLEGRCAGGVLCPLSRVEAGSLVCIKELAAAPEVSHRLRELGFCEEQQIRVVACQSSFICQVCNARLGISKKLADSILVQAVPV